jgi:hypothetical protein
VSAVASTSELWKHRDQLNRVLPALRLPGLEHGGHPEDHREQHRRGGLVDLPAGAEER